MYMYTYMYIVIILSPLRGLQTYGDQVRAMQIQYDKLLGYGGELTENPAVGARDSIAVEMRELRFDWERLRDTVMDSLSLLQREYDDWVSLSLSLSVFSLSPSLSLCISILLHTCILVYLHA